LLTQDNLRACVRAYGCIRRLKLKKRLIINLTIGLSLLAATIAGINENNLNQAPLQTEIEQVKVEEEIQVEKEVEPKQSNKTVKEIVIEHFADVPVMADIAFCESRFRQFDQDGSVLKGEANRADVGVFQINEKYHAHTAVKLNMNIYTLEGNMEYARHLYDKFGTDPWVYSSKCWNKGEREVALAK